MSALEQTIATLQQQLHAENQRRFQQIEKNQDSQKRMLDQILLNTAELPALKEKVEKVEGQVDELKESHQRTKGASALGAVILGSWELIRFVFTRH